MHLGAPPPPPEPPEVSLTGDPTDAAHQLLHIACTLPSRLQGVLPSEGLRWRVQCVSADVAAAADGGADADGYVPVFLDLFDESISPPRWAGESRGVVLHEPVTNKRARSHVRFGGERGLREGTYLWRVAAIHPAFGEGPFSAVAQYTVARGGGGGGGASLTMSRDEVRRGLAVRRSGASPLVASAEAVRHALAFAPLDDYTSVAAGFEQLANIDIEPVPRHEAQLALASGARAVLPPVTFEEAVQPTVGVPGGGSRRRGDDGAEHADGGDSQPQQFLHCVGEAEVWQGALELTPLRKGIGINGAAWFHRPIHVADGFETEFTFRINKPEGDALLHTPEAARRASDGFAFVLQRDQRATAALGESGTGLGFGGLAGSLAVQFRLTPSCARRRKRVRNEGEAEEEETVLCVIPDSPHGDVFLVPASLAEKECVCPFPPHEHFFAPSKDDMGYGAPPRRVRGGRPLPPRGSRLRAVRGLARQLDGARGEPRERGAQGRAHQGDAPPRRRRAPPRADPPRA